MNFSGIYHHKFRLHLRRWCQMAQLFIWRTCERFHWNDRSFSDEELTMVFMALLKQFTTSNYRFTMSSMMIKISTAGCLVKRHLGMLDSSIFNSDEHTCSDYVLSHLLAFIMSFPTKTRKKERKTKERIASFQWRNCLRCSGGTKLSHEVF